MMGACGRVMLQPSLAVVPFGPQCDRVAKAIFSSSWKGTPVSTSSSAATTTFSRPRRHAPIAFSKLQCRSFGTTVVKGSRKVSSPAPISKVVGHYTFDVWTSRRDLQRCEAVLHEDLGETESVAEIIDGKAIAKDIRNSIAEEVAQMKENIGKVPGLAVVLVGNRTDSATYVRSKKKACEEVGITSFEAKLPEDASEEEVLESVRKFNSDPDVHGILVQLPLPKHMSEEKVVSAVDIEKDVDGFHPLNVGRLALQGRTPLHVSCTPRGCIELLLRSGVAIKGKHAVVIGRSNVVGMPVAILLQRQNATVTVVHSHTPNPAEVTRSADIVIAAVGVAHLVRGDWIKPGAVVIDVGINSVEDPKAKKGYRLVGDVCYQEAAQVASKITPVPGGVGPMTIAMLLSNTLDSAKRSFGLTDS
ncbi:unnamed protein product [Calypogeia fissa]